MDTVAWKHVYMFIKKVIIVQQELKGYSTSSAPSYIICLVFFRLFMWKE